MFPVAPTLAYIRHWTITNSLGFWLHFTCDGCGDQSRRRCNFPDRRGHWLAVYEHLHRGCSSSSSKGNIL